MVDSKQILVVYKGIVLTIFILSLVSFIMDPFGRFIISYGKYSISSVTTLTFSFSISFLLIFYEHIPPLPRILCSLTLPVLGMAFHETFWHYGCWVTWKTGLVKFWTLYTVAISTGTYVLDQKYDILAYNTKRYLQVIFGIGCYIILFLTIYTTSFYKNLVFFEQGLGLNPHTPGHYLVASWGRLLWLTLVNGENVT